MSLINCQIKFQFKLTNVSYNILQSLATRHLFLTVTYSANPEIHANNYKVSFSCCLLAYCYFWYGFQKDGNYFKVVDGPWEIISKVHIQKLLETWNFGNHGKKKKVSCQIISLLPEASLMGGKKPPENLKRFFILNSDCSSKYLCNIPTASLSFLFSF